MADFTTNMTGTADVDNSLIQAYAAGIMIANGQEQALEPLVSVQEDIGAVSIRFTKYSRLPIDLTPAVETEDLPAMKLSDSQVIITPKEYFGKTVRTKLASIQTGGRVDMGTINTIGKHMGAFQDALIIQALMAAPAGNKEASAVSGAQLDGQYVKLASKSVDTIAGGAYVAVMNEAQIAVLRAESSWFDVQKYASADAVLKNEVGFYKGHRIVRHARVAANHAISLGANALGKAVSETPKMFMTMTDSANRFLNVGWYGVFEYGIIDTDAVEILTGVYST